MISDSNPETTGSDTCSVCLLSYVNPVRLPCGHIFCFLCTKGAANLNHSCALCRKPFPRQYFDRPDVVEVQTPTTATSAVTAIDNLDFDTVVPRRGWYYEGHSGWWQYDQRANADIDAAFTNGQRKIDLLIAGFVYVIDFENMSQYRQNETQRRRRIKYDLVTALKKGIGGLKLNDRQRRDNQGNQPPLLVPSTVSTTVVTSSPQSSHTTRLSPGTNIVPSLTSLVSSATDTSPIQLSSSLTADNNSENNNLRSDADGGEETSVSQITLLLNRSIIDDSVPLRRPMLGTPNYQTSRSINGINNSSTVRSYVGNFESDSSSDNEQNHEEEETNCIRPTLIGEGNNNISRRSDFLLGSSTTTSDRQLHNNSSTLLPDSVSELHVAPSTD